MALGTPYPGVAEHVSGLLGRAPLAGRCRLVVDATGVGRPVVDMLTQRGLSPIAVTITGGDVVSGEGWTSYNVPKRDLVSLLQVTLQTDRLKFAAGLSEVPTLVRELLAFRVKISEAGHDSYGSWREGSHDDLVLALAVAVWVAEHWREPLPRRRGLGSVSYSSYS